MWQVWSIIGEFGYSAQLCCWFLAYMKMFGKLKGQTMEICIYNIPWGSDIYKNIKEVVPWPYKSQYATLWVK